MNSIEDMVAASVNKALADARHTPTPTPDQQIAERLTAARFREQVADAALAAGVRPAAIRHVVKDATEIFKLEGDKLAARNGQVDPNDPLQPLSPQRWLERLRVTDGYLFAAPPA